MALFLLLRRLLSVFYLMNHPAVPLRLKVIPVLALLYVLFPRDLIFDFRFPFGHLDDLLIVALLLSVFTTRGWYHVLRARSSKEEERKGSIPVDFEVLKSPKEEPEEPPKSDAPR